MPSRRSRPSLPPDRTETFETIANTIAERWAAKRDLWLGPRELESARSFLEHAGIPARIGGDGSLVVGDPPRTVSAARLFVMAFRRLRTQNSPGVRTDAKRVG